MKTTVGGALRLALRDEMTRDETVFLIGEDIGHYGGIFNVTKGLIRQFGERRVVDSPLDETGILGIGVGAAISGLRPVVEIMYVDFITICMDLVINNAAKMPWLSQGQLKMPLTIRANFGTGKGDGPQHSQCVEAWFMNVPGLTVVEPSTPKDAYGLLLGSIRYDRAVLFLEHKLLYALQGEMEPDGRALPLGKGAVRREGKDATLVSCGLMLHKAMRAAQELMEEGISLEVIDVRTVKPLDLELILESVKKTGRLVTVEENPYTGGWGLTVSDAANRELFGKLKEAPLRIASLDVPVPASNVMEEMVVPNVERIKRETGRLVRRGEGRQSGER
jgi:pyruvate/2-oxoglutarate/acetoin dehydrogenase E1 component